MGGVPVSGLLLSLSPMLLESAVEVIEKRRADLQLHLPRQREDVAATLVELISLPGKGSAGLALDLIKGETSIADAVRSAVDKQVSDFFD